MKIPLTLRLAYHGFRATVRAGLLFFLAWVFLIPASASETTALGARDGATYPAGLRMMRVAKVVVAVAPPRAYDLIAMGLRRDISPLMVRVAFTQIAAGNVMPASTRGNGMPVLESDRDIEGPRFITVD
ncbi:hypothetical protein BC777_3161 [Yoonia maricola]|uniref:Uncharacterized protein n=1 Tax=Yoonia maricola TaxID=420999 RepID=A0A2M8W2L5_9RHOB|nr:hypothetical protein [Yoonia maricola]PJI85163.1 hypothetical protein BC777_3161 [Yoonia maricola]